MDEEDTHVKDVFHLYTFMKINNTNEQQLKARKTYQSLPLESKVSYLFNAVQNQAGGIDEKQEAAVMLRHLMADDFVKFFSNLSPENQKEFKNNLLLSIKNEKNDILRRRMCDVASEVAKHQLDDDGDNSWPTFLNFLFQCADDPSLEMKEVALRVFTSVPGIFGNQQSNYLMEFKQMLIQSISVPDLNVQIQAVKSIFSFIIHHKKVIEVQKQFTDLLPNILTVINDSLIVDDDDPLIKSLIDLAENTPKFLKSQLIYFIDMCLKYLKNEEANESYRKMCLEVVSTLAKRAPSMMREESPKYITRLVVQVLELMATVEDNDDWGTPDLNERDIKSMFFKAISALGELACGLGGKIMLPLILSNVPRMLANQNWKFRHAALKAIYVVIDGCHKQMQPVLIDILKRILRFLQDPHPRIRFATCCAIRFLEIDFAPTFQKKFHHKVAPALLLLLDDKFNPRVQAIAGSALSSFCKGCPKEILLTYMDQIKIKLGSILQAPIVGLGSHSLLVLEQMVELISGIADTFKGSFVKFYDYLMPYLKQIICSANAPPLKVLRGKTIQCVSLIGAAVGQKKFLEYTSDIMDLMLETGNQNERFPENDRQINNLLISWAIMSEFMDERFKQYLPLVIGPVIAAASQKTKVVLLDYDDKEKLIEDKWGFIPPEQPKFAVLIPGLEEKANACEVLVICADKFKHGFAPYTEEVVKLMVPLLKFSVKVDVRSCAAEIIPSLLNCAETRGPEFLQHIWDYICPKLLRAIKSELEDDVAALMYIALREAIELLGPRCLSDKWMKDLLAILEIDLNFHFEFDIQRFERCKDEDYDDDEISAEDRIDKLIKMRETLHALFVTYETDFIQYFDLIVHQFAKLLESEKSPSDHQWGLCVFNDLIEFCGPGCAKYQEYFLRPMVGYVTDNDSQVRRAAIYGCGVLGMCGGPSFAGVCAEIMPFLLQVINSADVARSTDYTTAVSAIAKILEFNSSAVNVDDILPHWLRSLSLCEDEDEAPFVYGYLCKLIENNHPIVLGTNNSNIPNLIQIIVEAFLRDAIDRSHPVGERMIMIVARKLSNEEVLNACFAVLSMEQRTCLRNLLYLI